MSVPVGTRDALRKLLGDIERIRDKFNVEILVAFSQARAALAADENGESELVEALEYIAAPQDGVSRGTALDQLADVRETARKALAKHAKD